MSHTLETPHLSSMLYLAQGLNEVDVHRPVFTGDIYRGEEADASNTWIVLQHPCTLRVKGHELEERLLMAQVVEAKTHRSDWSKHPYAEMPLPDVMGEDDKKYVDSFRHLELVDTAVLQDDYQRIVTFSSYGINLLLQRWIFQNSRVIIPTMTFEEQIAGPYNEADLEAEWLSELEGTTFGGSQSFHEWIRASPSGSGERRQEILNDPQKRAFVRREMAQEIDKLIEQDS